MCQNGTRKITWEEPANLNLEPILHFDNEISELEESVSFITTVVHITDNEDYQIFDAMHSGNISLVLDIIESHKGVNAVDEYGQTALMAAVSAQNIPIISGLLNTRRPKVDVNMAKSVSLVIGSVTVFLR